jgi:ABC-type anion transport system duplicated permease subunit
VSDLATLVTAITGMVTAITGLVGALVMLVKVSRRERPQAARNLAAELAEAAKDGEITADELRRIAGGDAGEGKA